MVSRIHRILKNITAALLLAVSMASPNWGQQPTNAQLLDFDYLLTATTADDNLDIWHRTLRNTALAIPPTYHLYKEQPFQVLLIFQGFGLGPNGKADVTFDIKIFDPDGEEILQQKGMTGIRGEDFQPGVLALGSSQISLMFEPTDPFGVYRIETLAHDNISGKKKKRRIDLQLVPFGYAQPLGSMAHYKQWLSSYYQNPDPARALLAYLQFAEVENSVTGQLDFTQIAFFSYLLEKHPFLLKALADSYPNSDPDMKLKILFMLAIMDYRDAPYLGTLSEPEKAFFEAIRFIYPPNGYDPIISPQQLDVLWAEFYASGRYEPIAQIVSGLELAEFEGSLIEYGNLNDAEDADEKTKQDAFREVLFQSVRWSLLNNIRQHPLVRAYCEYLLQEGGLDENQRNQLAGILAAANENPSRVGSGNTGRGIPQLGIPNPFRIPTPSTPGMPQQ
ncbi:hypothetical protein [Rubellicoccus peritrichatus]|uniref:Uncharacterized protein n=1 Tax=Rubellicoccus peritrichatus TaxID=3080537 RepID=A0AAQ3L997_9BACT|nr:hypothetical protein [Puniceicoccus sp. CR14]WOO40284.1 hypothetical protein RZN69_16820 [Puniceicoccus sp. CR14]